MAKNVLVIGAGMGGLTLALRLAKKGYHVRILEKNKQPGGRINQLKSDGFTFDTGPSFFSMSYIFKEFAKDCGIQLPFTYYELDPLYTVNFQGNPKTFLLYKDISKLAQQFNGIEEDFEKKMQLYLEKSKKLFDDTIDIVIKDNFNSIADYLVKLSKVNPGHLSVLIRSFYSHVSHYFSSDEARQIISLVAFFLGRSPFETSAVYSLLSYTEFQHDGYFNVEGGMYRIVEGIVNELKKEKVSIIYDTEIVDFASAENRLSYLVDKNNQKWEADIYAINADAAVFRGKIFKRREFSERKLKKMEWTMGSLTIYLGLKCKLPQVFHHNYYLGTHYRNYANAIFKNPDALQKPYYYVNVLSKHNSGCAPDGCESLFFVCPVPDLRFKPDWSDKEKIVDGIIADFSTRISQDIRPDIISKTIYTPSDWQRQFNLFKGSGLGLSHKMLQIGGFRPKNYDEYFKNVFYVGASTVPGTGLPMVVISSRLAFDRISQYSDR
jgi:phytoene desaturase